MERELSHILALGSLVNEDIIKKLKLDNGVLGEITVTSTNEEEEKKEWKKFKKPIFLDKDFEKYNILLDIFKNFHQDYITFKSLPLESRLEEFDKEIQKEIRTFWEDFTFFHYLLWKKTSISIENINRDPTIRGKDKETEENSIRVSSRTLMTFKLDPGYFNNGSTFKEYKQIIQFWEWQTFWYDAYFKDEETNKIKNLTQDDFFTAILEEYSLFLNSKKETDKYTKLFCKKEFISFAGYRIEVGPNISREEILKLKQNIQSGIAIKKLLTFRSNWKNITVFPHLEKYSNKGAILSVIINAILANKERIDKTEKPKERMKAESRLLLTIIWDLLRWKNIESKDDLEAFLIDENIDFDILFKDNDSNESLNFWLLGISWNAIVNTTKRIGEELYKELNSLWDGYVIFWKRLDSAKPIDKEIYLKIEFLSNILQGVLDQTRVKDIKDYVLENKIRGINNSSYRDNFGKYASWKTYTLLEDLEERFEKRMEEVSLKVWHKLLVSLLQRKEEEFPGYIKKKTATLFSDNLKENLFRELEYLYLEDLTYKIDKKVKSSYLKSLLEDYEYKDWILIFTSLSEKEEKKTIIKIKNINKYANSLKNIDNTKKDEYILSVVKQIILDLDYKHPILREIKENYTDNYKLKRIILQFLEKNIN